MDRLTALQTVREARIMILTAAEEIDIDEKLASIEEHLMEPKTRESNGRQS